MIPKLCTLKEVSNAFNIPVSTLRKRCVKNKFKPTTNNGYFQYLLNKQQADEITKKELSAFNFSDVIYVTRTTEIYPSRLNYTPLNKL